MIRTACFLCLLSALPLAAQSSGPSARLRGETEAATTRKRLTEAQQKLRAGQATEAADEFQRILDESGDDLVPVPGNHFQPARKLVQQYLAALPTATLTAFQNRLEEPAKKLLDAGRRDRDPAPLRQLLGRYFISRPAEPAILLLGELLFERGDFRAAEQTWRLLLPASTAEELSYPNPKTDPGLVRAKLVQSAIFAGELTRAKSELASFEKLHPKASGRLAGLDGPFAATLAKLLAAPPAHRTSGSPGGWATFAGNASRDGALGEPLPRLPSEPTWRTPYPRQAGDKLSYRPASFPAAKSLAFHPVVLDGKAYVAEAGRIFSFDLKTGDGHVAFDARALPERPVLSEAEYARPNLLDADFTLTAHGGRLYARLGHAALPASVETAAGKSPESFLVVFQPLNLVDPPKNALTMKPIATLVPPSSKAGKVAWEGAPLVADGKLFAACSRLDERGRWVHSVVCYDDPPAEKPNWVVEVADTDASTMRHRHELLTLAGANIVLALPQGLAVAIDRGSGKLAWAFRSAPAARPPANGPQQDLCPAVYSGGRIFFAPAEGDQLYALDAETGRPVWEAGPMQIEQIVGVAQNRVVVTLAGPQKGIRAYDINTGSDREPQGWRNHDAPHLGTYGRGLLTPEAVLWPTKESLYRLSLLDGSVLGQPQAKPHGNLAFADGVLLVATPTELWGYVVDPKEPASPVLTRTLAPAEPAPAYRNVVRNAATTAPWDWPRTGLTISASRVLTPGAWPVEQTSSDEKAILVCDGTAIWSWPADLARPSWKSALKTPARIVRATFDDGHWIAWGDSTVVSIDAADGRVRWQFDSPNASAFLAGGSLAGSRFITCLGANGLLALDLRTGRIAWLCDPFGRPRFREFALAGAPAFNPHFLAVGDTVLIQKSDGERWTLSADTGRVLHTTPTCLTPWTAPPAATAGGLAIVSDGPALVVAVEPRSNRALWRYEAGGETNLSGAAPEVQIDGEDAFVRIGRNTGMELVHLDAKSGTGDWRNAALVPGGGGPGAELVFDSERLYLVQPRAVTGYSRSSGRKLWHREWPEGGRWQAIVTRGGLLVCRAEAEEPWNALLGRAIRRWAEWPTPVRALGIGLAMARSFAVPTAVIAMLDSETGEVLARSESPVVGPLIRIERSGNGALLLDTGGAGTLRAGR